MYYTATTKVNLEQFLDFLIQTDHFIPFWFGWHYKAKVPEYVCVQMEHDLISVYMEEVEQYSFWGAGRLMQEAEQYIDDTGSLGAYMKFVEEQERG